MPDKLAWGQSTLKSWGVKRLEAYPTSESDTYCLSYLATQNESDEPVGVTLQLSSPQQFQQQSSCKVVRVRYETLPIANANQHAPPNEKTPLSLEEKRGFFVEKAPVGVEPTMADLQSAALATWLRSHEPICQLAF